MSTSNCSEGTGAMAVARGAGANVLACEHKTTCSNPVEVALVDLFHFEDQNECVPGHMCVYCQTARDASCNPPNCFLFLVGSQYHSQGAGPVRAHADGYLSKCIVLWNSYGDSTMVCPEPISTAVC